MSQLCGVDGPVGLIGAPGAGKTTLADSLAFALIDRTGAPELTVDTGGVEAYADQYHAEDLDELTDLIWGRGIHCCYTPKDPDDFDALCGAIYAARGVILKVDELKNVKPVGRPIPPKFRQVLGEWRRCLVGCYVGTQLYEDCGDALHGLAAEWFFFRLLDADERVKVGRKYEIDPDVLKTLPSMKECALSGRPLSESYVHRKVGF